MAGRVALIALALAIASGSAAGTASSRAEGGLDLTAAHGLNATAIMQGLDITPDQKRALKANLSSYNSLRGWPGLDRLGLTSEQKSLVQKRINLQVAAWNAHPLGWPCAPFTHRAKSIAWLKAKLIANGFRSALRVTSATTRQVQMSGIQDGIDVWIVMARSGTARKVTVSLSTTHSGGGSYQFTLPFVP